MSYTDKNKVRVIGNGFVGSYLFSQGMPVVKRFDLENYESMDFGQGWTYIFTAGMAKPAECLKHPKKTARVADGTIRAIQDITENNRVIFLSSDVVLGKDTPYSISKKHIEAYCETNDNVHIARLSYVFSDIEGFEDGFCKYVQSQERVDVFLDYERNIIHLEDVKDGLVQMVRRWANSPSVVNLSGHDTIGKWELVESMGKYWDSITDKEAKEKFFEDKDTRIEMKPNWYNPTHRFTEEF